MALNMLATTLSEGSIHPTLRKIKHQAYEVLHANWHLGFTAFGGPPVHFQIFHQKFVDNLQWIDEQTEIKYQEFFAIAQALPGPGSTKMLFNINAIRGGFLAGAIAFLIWSLPGAIGMFCFSLGVSRIGERLPGIVYALLSGLNAATVGIIALAAVQLAQKVITDKLTRILVFLGGSAGMLYTALWYFPVLMIMGGFTAVAYDLKLFQRLGNHLLTRNRHTNTPIERTESESSGNVLHTVGTADGAITTSSERDEMSGSGLSNVQATQSGARSSTPSVHEELPQSTQSLGTPLPPQRNHSLLSWQRGTILLGFFAASFLAIMLVRGLKSSPGRVFSVFANLFLAGTIIFGGGPVVIPLLREYVVAEGWVSPRDFLLGLALIQAFPGPNFNFAVYLGALAVAITSTPSVIGAIVAFLGIFMPGLVVQTGFMGIWGKLRKNRALLSALRGINAAAVGLVFTAIYRLWQIGLLDENNQVGQPLGGSPWWVVVTATSFVGGTWFGLPPFGAVLLGAVMGLLWWAVVHG